MLFTVFIIWYSGGQFAEAGCYQKRLCCPGRNLSCIAIDDGIAHLPFLYTTHSITAQPSHIVFENEERRIGELAGDDLIEVEGSGNQLDKFGALLSSEQSTFPEPLNMISIQSTVAPTFRHLIFGESFLQDDQPSDNKRDNDEQGPLSMMDYDYNDFSIINKHVPLILVADPDSIVNEEKPKLMYLEKSESNVCFCDERCVILGDCCSDYTFVCPPSDCYVSEWSGWSSCRPDNSEKNCGEGVRTRTRMIAREARFGGVECPPLIEKTVCFKNCERSRNSTSVALILDYKYNKTRETLARDNIYWDLAEVSEKLQMLSYYCVFYELGWVNNNCIDKKVIEKLYKGNVVCAECQPEVQFHRSDLRCASDLEDGNRGFWKLIGPQSCNGIWKRILRTDNCKCGALFPHMDAFLLA